MNIALIVACGKNGLIGDEGELPWHLPNDLKRFKSLTYGKAIVMGRKTWLSLPFQPLPGRKNIVLSRNQSFTAKDATCIHSPNQLSQHVNKDETCFVIGGQEVFKCFLPQAQMLYLTLVNSNIKGDTYFPPCKRSDWELVQREEHPQDEQHPYTMEFLSFRRLASSGEAGGKVSTGDADSFFSP